MIAALAVLLEEKRVSILGFGREGISSYRYIRKFYPEKKLIISDMNPNLLIDNPFLLEDKNVEMMLGEKYLDALDADVIIKSPGVNLKGASQTIPWHKIHTQTSLFLEAFHRQTIGITGTKGKSTTSTLIYHVLQNSGQDAVLLGNIGVPPFDRLEEIGAQTHVVLEMSAHQLEHIQFSPYIAVLLNLFQEHLDYFGTLDTYFQSKLNIARHQNKEDICIYNADDALLQKYISDLDFKGKTFGVSQQSVCQNGCCIEDEKICMYVENECKWALPVNPLWHLKGAHNLFNMQTALVVAYCLGVSFESICASMLTFKGLEHRLEYVGQYNGVHYYNDSIATIPEAVIQAVETLGKVDTLILGGFDRGIDYQILVDFLCKNHIPNLIFTGEAGKRIREMLVESNKTSSRLYFSDDYAEIVSIAKKQTNPGRICLLSPAAASYDAFKNFEERGNCYKNLIKERN